MSRARDRSTVYVVADDLDQACSDLTHDWTVERRQRWAIDTGTPGTVEADVDLDPSVSSRLGVTIRRARLESERDAILDVMPPDLTGELNLARNRLAFLQRERHQLERGTDHHLRTPEGSSAWQRHQAERDLASARHRADDHRRPRAQRRQARRSIQALEARLAAANERWKRVGAPVLADLDGQIAEATAVVDRLAADVAERSDWLAKHPEAPRRLAHLAQELDALRPQVTVETARVVGLEPPARGLGRDIDGLGLSL